MFLCCMGVQVPSATYSTARHSRITSSDRKVGHSSVVNVALFAVHMFRHKDPGLRRLLHRRRTLPD